MIFEKRELLFYFLIESIFFSLVLFLGIISSYQIKRMHYHKMALFPSFSLFDFLSLFFFTTFLFYLLMKLLKRKTFKKKIYKGIFLFVSLFSGTPFLEIWLREPLPFIFILFLIFWWLIKPNILNQNILMAISIIGIGSFFGFSLKPETMVAILFLFSIYDIIAVYKTRHMVTMAKEMVEQNVIFGFVIPPNLFSFKEKLSSVQAGKGNFFILGGGDVVFPLLFSTSLISQGLLPAIIVAIFSLIGLFFSFYFFVSQKNRQPIPALPPIAIFANFGYLLTKIF